MDRQGNHVVIDAWDSENQNLRYTFTADKGDSCTIKISQYLSRLIAAGVTGLADILLLSQVSPTYIPPVDRAVSTLAITSNNHSNTLIQHELKPITWFQWFINISLFSLYISEPGRGPYLFGIDLTSIAHRYILRITPKMNNRTTVIVNCSRIFIGYIIVM